MADETFIKVFEGKNIRVAWSEEEEKYYFSVVDVVQVLTDSADAKQYIKRLRSRDPELDFRWGTICTPTEMRAADGKMYMTQAADLEGIFRLIQSIPSKKAEPIKQWLASVGAQRIDQMIDPEQTFQMAIEDYRRQGYSDKWITERMRSIERRKELTDEWQRAGVHESRDFAILTNVLTKAWSGKTVGEYIEWYLSMPDHMLLLNDEECLYNFYELPRMADVLAKAKSPKAGELTKKIEAYSTALQTRLYQDALEAANTNVGNAASAVSDAQGANGLITGALPGMSDGLDNLSTAASGVANGLSAAQQGVNQKLAPGATDLSTGATELSKGVGTLQQGAGSLSTGIGQLQDGASQLSTGIGELETGAGSLSEGVGQLQTGAGSLSSGIEQLETGAGSLSSGAEQLGDGDIFHAGKCHDFSVLSHSVFLVMPPADPPEAGREGTFPVSMNSCQSASRRGGTRASEMASASSTQ